MLILRRNLMASRNILQIAGVVMNVGETISDSVLKRDYVGITQATKMLGIAHAQYVRRLVVGSKLGSISWEDRRFILLTTKSNWVSVKR